MSDPLFDSLFAALDADPANSALRLQVAQLLCERGRAAEAVAHLGQIVASEPGNIAALTTLARATQLMREQAGDAVPATPTTPTSPSAAEPLTPVAAPPADSADSADSAAEAPPADPSFDWSQAEADLGEAPIDPPFLDRPQIAPGESTPAAIVEELPASVTLADVGGLEPVKQRLRESFLEPMKHPELARAFGKSMRGGLVLYGPPGCGKTFIARAVAGELGARFLTVSIADIMGSFMGETEKNIQALFARARSLTPAVLFLDELDAIGARRSGIGNGWSGMRAMVDQLLLELDSMSGDNDGLFVLAATNSPWDVDNALLRPGRLDRMILVLPPDAYARDAILRTHLSKRPIAGIDLPSIVHRTEGFSGADLEHVAASAAEQAMLRSIEAGEVRPITMVEIDHVLAEIKPSTGAWLASARNVAQFGNADGRYDDLAAYLTARGMM